MIPARRGLMALCRMAWRALARQAGYEIEELPYSRERTHCCGYGGLTSLTNREVNEETVSSVLGRATGII